MKALYSFCWNPGTYDYVNLSYLDDFEEEYDREGVWSSPFPNTPEDSYIFALLESIVQDDVPVGGSAALQAMIFARGMPAMAYVSKFEYEEETF